MNKRTKMILSAIGVAALVVPAILLLVVTSRTKEIPSVPTEERKIDPMTIQNSAGQTASIQPSPTSSAATSSAQPEESTESSSIDD